MRKKLCLSFAVILVVFTFVGCKTNTVPTSVMGQWSLEAISSGDEGVLAVGKAYDHYDDFDGEKKDIRVLFKEDGTFEMGGSKENLQGEYKQEEKLNTEDTIAITMNFENETQTTGMVGIRQYQNGEEVNSLTFAIDEKIYSFIKMEAD